jgi:valyl-tRNA synthetase
MSRPRLEGARNFANKIWNAARFVMGSRPDEIAPDAALEPPNAEHLSPADEWILDRCARTIESVERAYADYQFGEVARTLFDAIWSEYCDWYLEMAKAGLSADAPASARVATWKTLSWVLDRYLRLLHPLMPFVTEEIWQRTPHLADDPELLIVAPWPSATVNDAWRSSADGVAALIDLIGAMRAARAEALVQPGDRLDALIWLPDGPARAAFDGLAPVVDRLARISATRVAERAALDEGAGAIAVVTPGGEARLLRSDADRAKDRARLEKEFRNVEGQLAAAEQRLADPNFVGRAPADVVDQARQRVSELTDQMAALRARLDEA